MGISKRSFGGNMRAYNIPLEKGSVIVPDRYYNDFPLLNLWDSKEVFFAIRHKGNLAFCPIEERELPKTTTRHVLNDEEIELTHPQSKAKYPGRLRRIPVWNEENQQAKELITNNFAWVTQTNGDLYKSRWEIEVFFRDIK